MRKKLKKLIVGILSFYHPHLGGSGITTSRLAVHLARQGHEVHFIGYDSDENPSYMRREGIHLHKVSRVDYPCLKSEPYTISLASYLCNVDKEVGFDLVHANYAVPHAISAYLARQQRALDGKKLPYIVTGHGSDIHTNGNKDSINPMLKLALNEADALTFVSEDLKGIAESELGITKNGVVIPNFVDPNDFYPAKSNVRKRNYVPEHSFVISHVSNFAPVKQVLHFSRLANYLKMTGELDNIYFLMGGDGRERSILEEEIRKSDVSEHFRFLGRLSSDEVRDVYNASDCVLLTSKHEGNPLVLIEAMACGKPVIGSKVGGIEETISGGGGLLFDYWNIGNLVSKVRLLKEDSNYRMQLGKEALQKAQTIYSPEKVLDSYVNVFREVVENAKASS